MAEDNKDLIGKAVTGADSKTTKKTAAPKADTKTAAKATETSPAPPADSNPTPETETPQTVTPADTNPAPTPETPATGDPKGSDPSPEFRGKSAEDLTGKPPTPAPEEKPETGKKDDALTKLAKEYLKLYPKNKTFYITSDKQVFLEGSKGLAELHQRSQKGGKVSTITID